MDFSKFKTSDWLKAGGALVFLIAFFLSWWKADVEFIDFSFKGSDYFLTGVVPLILLLIVGVVTFLLASGMMKRGNLPWPVIFLAATALSTLLVLFRLFGPGHGAPSNSGLSRGIGLYLAFVSAIVTLVGSALGFTEAGGNWADLKDMNKLKASFQGAGGGSGEAPPPPPPPSGMTPPPPPPPPG